MMPYSIIYSAFSKDIEWEVKHGLDLTGAYHALSLFRSIGYSMVVNGDIHDDTFQTDLNYLTNIVKDKNK